MKMIAEFFEHYPELVYVMRIVLAGICGGIIGVERTLRQKDAGFRTHIIVAMGAALMMTVSKYGFYDVVNDPTLKLQVDASRIASNIITGISFLGAGMIFVKGVSIKGLTTAAGIWVTAAVGMAIGSGLYAVGLISVVILLLVQIIFHKFLIGFDKVLASDNMIPCFVQVINDPQAVNDVKVYIKQHGIHISDSTVDATIDNSLITMRLNIQCGKDVNPDTVFSDLLKDERVKQAFAL